MHDGKWASERRAERDVEQNREGKKERDVYNVTNVTGLVVVLRQSGGGAFTFTCTNPTAKQDHLPIE
jgi:hypothetical protein